MLFYRGLTVGGTERQIVALAEGLAARGHAVRIVTFYGDNPLGAGLAGRGVELVSLDKSGRWDLFGFIGRFLGQVRKWRPDAIYSFLPVSNIVALSAKLARPRLPVVWGVRTAFLDLSRHDWLTRHSYTLEARAAWLADTVIANSHAALAYLKQRGFANRRIKVVLNGIDVDRFHSDPEARDRLRAEWGVGHGSKLVGTVARLDPEKGIELFLEAAARMIANDPSVVFIAVGGGSAAYRETLVALAGKRGLGGKIIWAGPRSDMPAVYAALDLLVLASPNEGTSNVVLEALACGLPVVATDVGDNKRAIGDCGQVVPLGEAGALAEAIARQLDRVARDGATLAAQCRRRILDDYTLDTMVAATEAILRELATA